MQSAINIESVDKYIASFPEPTGKLLKEMREIILKNAPEAEEYIGYQMPAYKLHGVLAYFAGYKHHIGFYPSTSGIENFKEELSVYKGAKGSVQFPLDKPLPVKLITRIIKFRVKENIDKSRLKQLSMKSGTGK